MQNTFSDIIVVVSVAGLIITSYWSIGFDVACYKIVFLYFSNSA